MTHNSGKVFRAELETKENFKRHSDGEIGEAFRDLFINMSVESVVVERAENIKEVFRLVVDGVEINNVDKFKISPAFTKNGLPMTLPVRCFLPF